MEGNPFFRRQSKHMPTKAFQTAKSVHDTCRSTQGDIQGSSTAQWHNMPSDKRVATIPRRGRIQSRLAAVKHQYEKGEDGDWHGMMLHHSQIHFDGHTTKNQWSVSGLPT